MNNSYDVLTKEILKVLDESQEPLEIKEIKTLLKKEKICSPILR